MNNAIPDNHLSPLKVYGAFLFLGCVWGASFMFMRVGVPEFTAPAFSGLRVSIAGLLLLPIFLRPKRLKVFKRHWLKLSINGIISPFIPFMMFSFALNELNAGVTSVINSSVPMITALIAFVFFKERLSKQQILGLAIGFSGVLILMYDGISSGMQGSLKSFLMALSACISYSIGSNFSRNYLQEIAPMTIASSGLIAAGVVSFPLTIFFFPFDRVQDISWQAWGSLLTIAVVSTAMAMALFFQLIQQIGATKTTMVTLIIPLFGILFGITLLGEKLTMTMLIGSAVVLTGTAMAMFAKNSNGDFAKKLMASD